jgi:hypothetical protein
VLPKLSLDFDGAGYGVHGAREFHQRAVAHELDTMRLSNIFRRWLEVISPFADSNGSMAKTLYGPNMTAFLRTTKPNNPVRARVGESVESRFQQR